MSTLDERLKDQQDEELIWKFIDEELSAEELSIFKSRLKANNVFKKEVQEWLMINAALQAACKIGKSVRKKEYMIM